MSAEYSVEEVRARLMKLNDFVNSICSNEEAGRKCLGFIMQYGEFIAERIEADESAVAEAFQHKRRPEDYPDEWRECSKEAFDTIKRTKDSPWIVRELFDAASVAPIKGPDGEVSAADFATAMRNCGLSLKTYAEVDQEARRLARVRLTHPPTQAAQVDAWKLPPCSECGAKTAAEAETMCICSGDKDDCHGTSIWPDDAPTAEPVAQPSPDASDSGRVDTWRCFHCDETFTDADSATEHFGASERQNPACQIDIAEYRAMEARMVRYNDEDADIHRQMRRMDGEHQQALRRAEEDGYAKGLAALAAQGQGDAVGIAKGVAETVNAGAGTWQPCSGCYETEGGHPVGRYPYSEIFQCTLGGGCHECGGLGAVWDDTDYDALVEEFRSSEAAPADSPAGVPDADTTRLEFLIKHHLRVKRLNDSNLWMVLSHDGHPSTGGEYEEWREAIDEAILAAAPSPGESHE